MNEPEITGYYTLRRDYIRLGDDFNKKRLELIEVQKAMSVTITQLVEAGERIFTKALTELDNDGNLRKEYKPETNIESVADHIKPDRAKPEPTINDNGDIVQPGKRACSLCRKPGHRAKNCPNAHIVQAEKKAAVAARPVKRKRGPVSPERRKQLSEQLKKARAARKHG